MHFKAQEALAKIDSAMDRIQQRLQETHALFNQEMKETEGMPTEEKLARQRKALSDFKAVLPTLLSLASAGIIQIVIGGCPLSNFNLRWFCVGNFALNDLGVPSIGYF